MLLSDVACIVRDEFKGPELKLMRREHPQAKVLVYPESPPALSRRPIWSAPPRNC
jgi:quinolinate synthase